MTQVSKYPISKEVEGRIFEVLTEVIADLKQSLEINEFLEDFLSPVEKIMLAKRLSIAVLLAKGYDYRQIQKILHVTPPTIASVNLSLKYTGQGYKRVVEKIIHGEKMEEFWQKVDDVIADLVPPKGRNWSYWRKGRWQKNRLKQKPF
jgi:uncharacterized protein YerC